MSPTVVVVHLDQPAEGFREATRTVQTHSERVHIPKHCLAIMRRFEMISAGGDSSAK